MFLITKPSEQTVHAFIASQQDLPFSYPEVGATKSELPAGYTHDHNRIELGQGRDTFETAVAALKDWKHFDLGWVTVVPPSVPVETGNVVAIRARTFNIWSLSAARIVYVLEEDGPIARFGFAYGTLPDHVEQGEERFLIEWDQTRGTVWYDIVAFSRPRHRLVKLGNQLARRLQKRFARESMARMTAEVGD